MTNGAVSRHTQPFVRYSELDATGPFKRQKQTPYRAGRASAFPRQRSHHPDPRSRPQPD
jgi:hypothetical protein